MFKIDDYVRPIQVKTEAQPKVQKPVTQTQTTTVITAKKADAQYIGASYKTKLEKQYAANQPTPYKALEQINNLPKPDLTDSAAVKAYKEQRKTIADNAIVNSQPPKIEDFRKYGLNGATASYEYEQAKTAYDSQVRDLKKISADAAKYPDKILTLSEAQQEIDKLPRPDRSNPQSVLDYNNRRAAIADSALLYAKPPTRDDFKSLPGRTGAYEYQEALKSFNSSVAQLKEDSSAGGTTILPKMTDAEADKAATDYINARGGVNNEDDAYGVGEDLAALAKTDPEGAALVMQKVQDKLETTKYGDNVASGFVDKTSVEDLRKFSQMPGGEAILRDLQNHLTSGDVHEGEYKESDKIDEAITGLNPQSLNGNPEHDAKAVDQQLQKLPPDMREKYIAAVLAHPAGGDAIKYAGTMSVQGQAALGKALGDLYAKDPTGTMAKLHEITDSKDATLYPWYLQSGLATAISKSGNDGLIKEFAQNEINRAKGNPDEVRGYVNAITAYAGLSPAGLQDVMKNNPDFFKAASEAGKFSATYSGVIENGYGDLLKKAADVTDANGNPTPEALRLFKDGIQYAGDNISTKEGLGEFFVKNQDAIVNGYLNRDGYDLTSDGLTTLDNFFKSVLFSPPLGANAKEVAKTFTERANTVLADAQKLSDADFEAKYHQSRDKMSSLVGEEVGVMVHALGESLREIKENASDEDAKNFFEVVNTIITSGQIYAADTGPVGVGIAIIGEPIKLALDKLGVHLDENSSEEDYKKAVEQLRDGGIDPKQFDGFAINDLVGKIENKPVHDNFAHGFAWVQTVFQTGIEVPN